MDYELYEGVVFLEVFFTNVLFDVIYVSYCQLPRSNVLKPLQDNFWWIKQIVLPALNRSLL